MGIHWIDALILIGTIAFITIYGMVVSRKSDSNTNEFMKGGKAIKWWGIGLSVMATQASAITFMSTPGQAYHDGMGFVQFYFGLPIAMVIICVTFIPIYHKLNVFTAYEFLENRFDNKTRSLTSILFLIQRGLGAAITIYAPSIILSTILGWNLNLLNFLTGFTVIIYIISGGARAISVTQNQQMAVMIGGMVLAFFVTIHMLPEQIDFNNALSIAGANDKMKIIDFSFNLENRYTFWSGITGGMFLALAYFGTDQSQVQRYISGGDVRNSRLGLVFNGLLKVPMQFFILLCGIMVFVFFQFNQAPIFFNESTLNKLKHSKYKTELQAIEIKYDSVFNARKNLLSAGIKYSNDAVEIKKLNEREKSLRNQVKGLISQSGMTDESNDKDYVFISFVLKYLPIGVIGLLLAVVFCAAMSSSASELSALASCTTFDIYKRNFRQHKDDKHYLSANRWFTLLWGLIAIGFANISSLFENLIQFVNIVGSLFYGTILGIFLCGFYIKRIKANNVFIAAIVTEIIVFIIYRSDAVGYLWLNAIGCGAVVVLGFYLSLYNKQGDHTI